MKSKRRKKQLERKRQAKKERMKAGGASSYAVKKKQSSSEQRVSEGNQLRALTRLPGRPRKMRHGKDFRAAERTDAH